MPRLHSTAGARIVAMLALLAAAPPDAAAQDSAAAGTPPTATSPATGPATDSAIEVAIRARVEGGAITGIVLARARRGTEPVTVAAGRAGPGDRPALDARTVFEIGSIGKTFTGVLLADMVARGEVALDDPVTKYLPDSVTVPALGGRQITLLHLATHHSGLPSVPFNLRPADASNPYADYTVQQMYDFLSSYTPVRAAGERYEYSNLGAGLLGHVLALRAGKSYEELVLERIAGPLGMVDTRIALTPSMKERFATGHVPGGEPTSAWDVPTLAGAGALRSTAADMLRYVQAAMDTTTGPLAKAFALATRQHAAMSPLVGIGLAWHLAPIGGRRVVWHNGQTGGFHAFAAFDRDSGTAVVLLTNTAADVDDIGLHAITRAFPIRPPAPTRTEVAVDSAVLERHVGTYRLAPQFSIEVTREGSALHAQATGQPRFRLYAESPTRFFLKAVEARVTFEQDASGATTALVLHQNGRDMRGERVR